jgi:hypothetical protein
MCAKIIFKAAQPAQARVLQVIVCDEYHRLCC